jgi:hypothetical protein
LLVARVNLDRIPSNIMAVIHEFMRQAVNQPNENWLDGFFDKVRGLWGRFSKRQSTSKLSGSPIEFQS